MRYVHVAVGLEETVLIVSGRRMKHIAAVCAVARDRSGINKKWRAKRGKSDRNRPATKTVGKLRVSAPKARNVKAWASGPGWDRLRSLALKARNDSESGAITYLVSPRRMSRLQRYQNSGSHSPRALPWAITFRAFGAETWSFTHPQPPRGPLVVLRASAQTASHPLADDL
jgi:hypothetical protein